MQSKGLSRVFSNTTVQKHQFFGSAFFTVQLSHPYITTGKTIALTRRTSVGKVMSLLFYMLSRLVTEKAMAPHSSTLAWKLPWMEEPGGLQSMGSQRVGDDIVTGHTCIMQILSNKQGMTVFSLTIFRHRPT